MSDDFETFKTTTPKGMIQRIFKEEMLSFEYLDEVMVSNFLALQNRLIAEIKKEIESIYTVEFYLERQKILHKLIGEE